MEQIIPVVVVEVDRLLVEFPQVLVETAVQG
jgi:hypothetical protein